MGEEGEDVKPKLNIQVGQLELISCFGAEITIKVKANTPFKKIFEAAEKRFSKDPGTFKFTYDGQRIQADETPASLGMEDGDQIDANLEQLGGSLDASS
ncbi:hypothetical protein PC9H_002561 [Pleurotus ostreatus]|uniref:Ubiquitin-like domain-containing protein n=1 Tax=Pleurotus ostreatus TaxID=5322 RepID=A0A8H6ZJQ7_PLEOS|nr:uncharacterized protein PC9H_002561 [Pleurotus ostreatus]KAF7416296.1 hypothetical protein PC9H_002561 [Pleurotus ostreatus]